MASVVVARRSTHTVTNDIIFALCYDMKREKNAAAAKRHHSELVAPRGFPGPPESAGPPHEGTPPTPAPPQPPTSPQSPKHPSSLPSPRREHSRNLGE